VKDFSICSLRGFRVRHRNQSDEGRDGGEFHVMRRKQAGGKRFRMAFASCASHAPDMFTRNFGIALLSLVGTGLFAAEDAGWKPLFNGKNTEGWLQKGGVAKYRVEDGVLIGNSQPNTPNSFLCTSREYTNFILELEFKVAQGLNSGVQIRSHAYPTNTEVAWKGKSYKVRANTVHGYQVEIDTTARAWTGGIYEEGRRGWLNNLTSNQPARQAFKQNEWNKFRIEAVGDSIKTSLNGVPAADLRDSLTPSGFIALQVHGVGKRTNDLEVRFRNVRIKELP